jgi:hypothetical protein
MANLLCRHANCPQASDLLLLRNFELIAPEELKVEIDNVYIKSHFLHMCLMKGLPSYHQRPVFKTSTFTNKDTVSKISQSLYVYVG